MSNPPPVAGAPVRVALVGTGAIADNVHLPALRSLGPAVRVEAAMDVDAGRLAAVAARWDIAATYEDLDLLLKEVRPDLAIICSPPAVHREQVVAVLESGAWAWCEKPPVLSLAEYDDLAAAESDGGPYAAIVFQHRFGSGARHARRLLDEGLLGRPLVAHCQTTWFRDDAYYAVPWRGRWETEGAGPAMGLGIHQIDLFLHLLGPWSHVTAFAGRLARDVRTDDVTTAAVRFQSGALATVVNSSVSPRQVSYLRIDCEAATVELDHLYGYGDDDWTYTPAPGTPPEQVEAWLPAVPGEPSSHRSQLAALLADLRSGRRPSTSGGSGRDALEFITAMYKSALTGRTVTRGSIGPGDPFYSAVNGGMELP
ncbi:Gfo/Idh/MocA family protein [Jiangella rhizosphaerae]|uniref:Gfo/Idh/MocA family protein n=1 Tax=Jiangella rhizosphaerae TaxID=2293569 RepID=UPI0018F54916|nr:Gfo/Idh/MocA family oxidoreductase [Jiangella rhizosphaerae]